MSHRPPAGTALAMARARAVAIVVLLALVATTFVNASDAGARSRSRRKTTQHTAVSFDPLPTRPPIRTTPGTGYPSASAPAPSRPVRPPSATPTPTPTPTPTRAPTPDPRLRRIGFRSPDRLHQHYLKHGNEFGQITEAEYLRLAQDLRDAPISRRVLELTQVDGSISRFDRQSGAFLAFNDDLTIRTFFRPRDGEEYFRRAAQRRH